MSSTKQIRILAVLAIIFVVATTIFTGCLYAAFNAYSASKKQSITVNVNGDYNNSSVEINIEPSGDTLTNSTEKLYEQFLNVLTATITCYTAFLTLVLRIVQIKKKQLECIKN